MFFDQNGILDLDDLVLNQPAYKAIMEDGIVTEEELNEQMERVVNMMREAEKRFSEEDLHFIKQLICETGVLSAVYNYYELQNLKNYVNV